MDGTKTANRIHPLVAGAAVAVMLVSLTGVAAMTGLLPTSHSSNAPAEASAAQPVATVAQAAPAATAPAASAPAASLADSDTAPTHSEKKPAAPVKHHNAASHSTPQARPASSNVANAPVICASCGRIEAVDAIQHEAKPSGVGIAAGAVLGGVLGHQVGGGTGKKLATVAGAVGGGFAGNAIEKHARSTTSYEVRVRMEDGTTRTFPYQQQPNWNVGDRVRVIDGQLASRA